MKTLITLPDLTETDLCKTAEALSQCLLSPVTLCLRGNLGAGKTTFARAYIRAFTEDPQTTVPSPTYTLLQTYEGPKGQLFHYDFYRLETPEEVWELSLEDAFGATALIEWPEKGEGYLPSQTLWLTLAPDQEGATRHLKIEAESSLCSDLQTSLEEAFRG